eukprot:gene21315-biopygen16352
MDGKKKKPNNSGTFEDSLKKIEEWALSLESKQPVARPRPRKTPQQEKPSFVEVVKDAETGAYQWKNPGKPNRRRKSTKRATHSTGADWSTMQGGSSTSFEDPCYSDADDYSDTDACSPSNLESGRLKSMISELSKLENEFPCSKNRPLPVFPPSQCPECQENSQFVAECTSRLITIVTSKGYWLGSPQSTETFYSIDLLKLWDAISNNSPGTSLASFVKSIESISSASWRNYSDDKKCGDSYWQAARFQSKKSFTALDETGQVVAGCRHVIALKAVNMFAGEQYGYTLFLHNQLANELKMKFLWLDIMSRNDTLTERTGFWNKRKINNLANSLSVQYAKTQKKLVKVSEEKSALLNEIDASVTDLMIENWEADLKQKASYTSKKRIQLRKTMSSNKSSLGVTIEKYNVVARLQEAQHKDLIMEDVLCGKFQWNKDPGMNEQNERCFDEISSQNQPEENLKKYCLKQKVFPNHLAGIVALKFQAIAECKERVSEGVFLFKNVLGNSEVFNDQDEVEDDEFEDEGESEEEEEHENERFEKLLLAKEVLTTEEADIIAEEITLEGNESEETVPVDNNEAIDTDEVATTDKEAIDTEEVAQVDKCAGDTEESTTQDKEGEGAEEVATEDKKAND